VVEGELGVNLADIPQELIPKISTFNIKVRHAFSTQSYQLTHAPQMTVIIPFFIIMSSYLTKLSITHFYITLFPHTTIHLICRLQFGLLICSCIASIIRCFTLCQPFSYAWNRSSGGKCGNFMDFSLETSVLALVFDVTCVLLPIPVVWRLKLEWEKKIRLTVLFGLGLL
jgi:hypothetical protein